MYHFTSKAAIFLESLEQATASNATHRAVILHSTDASIEKLRKILHNQLPATEETRHEWAVWMQFWGSAPTHDDVKAATQASYNRWYSMMATLVQTTQSDGWLPQDQFFTDTLTALVDGLGIRIMTEVTTVARSKTIIDEFLTHHQLKTRPT